MQFETIKFNKAFNENINDFFFFFQIHIHFCEICNFIGVPYIRHVDILFKSKLEYC